MVTAPSSAGIPLRIAATVSASLSQAAAAAAPAAGSGGAEAAPGSCCGRCASGPQWWWKEGGPGGGTKTLSLSGSAQYVREGAGNLPVNLKCIPARCFVPSRTKSHDVDSS